MTVESDEVTETVGHKEEADTLLHHLSDVTSEATEFDEAFEDDLLRQLVAVDPINARSEFGEDSTGRLEYQAVDLTLFLSEPTIDGERDGHIRAVVMEGVTLVCKHGLPINQRLVVVLIMKGGRRGSASANGQVGFHTSDGIILLAPVNKEALQLALAHSWLSVLHDVNV